MMERFDQTYSYKLIYVFSMPYETHKGLLKVGYTAIDVDKRVAQQYPTKRPDGSVPYPSGRCPHRRLRYAR